MVVYVDLFILLNLIINSIIIILTGWTLGRNYNFKRYFIAVMIAVGYSLLYLLYDFTWISNIGVKFTLSIIIILIAFKIKSFQEFIRILGVFYMISFILGGAVYGYFFLEFNQKYALVEKKVNWQIIMKGLIIGCCSVLLLTKSILQRTIRKQSLYKIKVQYKDKSIALIGLLDTGNQLYTICGHKPVVIIDKYALEPLFNHNINDFLKQIPSQMWVNSLEKCHDESWVKSLFFIPYKGIGTCNILIGFKPDELIILSGVNRKLNDKFIIAIYDKSLVEDEQYRALLHSEFLYYL